MAGYVASGATFTFCGVKAIATRVSVESPTAEIVDMTAHNAAVNATTLVPTGAWVGGGGTVDVEFLQSPQNGVSPLLAIGKVGQASFSGNTFSINNHAVCESATVEAAVGDLVRGTMRLRFTDFTVTDTISGSSF
jgi:hypothetical protein